MLYIIRALSIGLKILGIIFLLFVVLPAVAQFLIPLLGGAMLIVVAVGSIAVAVKLCRR